ncbi:unnamed protein product [Linum tenue]|uniref:RRM domain-containing protein n=1 Tax=Linum tenue TaxID=586396 RepID=A0AAV0H490_9ROSI|nr:unnamed protein product [Linum tenue]
MAISNSTIQEIDLSFQGKGLEETSDFFQRKCSSCSEEQLAFNGEAKAGIDFEQNVDDAMQLDSGQPAASPSRSGPLDSELNYKPKDVLYNEVDRCKGESITKSPCNNGGETQTSADHAQESLLTVDDSNAGNVNDDTKLDTTGVASSGEQVGYSTDQGSPNVNNSLSTNEAVQGNSMARKDRRPRSPGTSCNEGKEAGSDQHHLCSSTARITPASPKRLNHKHSSSASPQVHNSPNKHSRHGRSRSRSPIKQRDSSSVHRRDRRSRSRSRSPRTRHSPRRRSPTSGRYHSSRYSPLRRSWVPPPNRRTGFGKPGNNLFIAGFSFLTTERDLERKFSRFGRVRDVRIVRDRRSGDSRGFGFLSLERDEEADAAIKALDETEWNGRIILVEKSKSH